MPKRDQVETSELDFVLLTATEGEQALLRDSLDRKRHESVGHRQVVLGQIGDKRLALVTTGIGLVNTAQALTAMLETRTVHRIIQLGIGGAYPSSSLHLGDVAVATQEIAAEYGVVDDDGWSGGDTIGIPLIESEPPTYNHISLDKPFGKDALRAAQSLADDANYTVASGPFVTVQTVTGSEAQAKCLDERFGALCENMEGAASAHVCAIYGVPLAEVRGISNIIEKRDLSRWNIPLAATRAQQTALELITTS